MGIEVIAINDLADAATLAHLLRFDSTHGPLGVPVTASASSMDVNNRSIPVTAHSDPAYIDWASHGTDLAIELPAGSAPGTTRPATQGRRPRSGRGRLAHRPRRGAPAPRGCRRSTGPSPTPTTVPSRCGGPSRGGAGTLGH
ncbi:glyceraldehyde 3-phosphate dehydrogenase NAD-binding domain-containing protein [Microbispora maris]|uniref:glyceraldehyde 3-phosphate dehydrogenase NAD-binding domain-containing protein n=1 Tax=Microbispora maris TaxID=3144104 RepID=UPI003D154E5B